MQDPKPVPWVVKKKKKKKIGHAKAAGARLEGFMDWISLVFKESAEEEEADMCGLIFGFVARMCKLAANGQGEISPDYEAPGRKCPKLFCLDEEA